MDEKFARVLDHLHRGGEWGYWWIAQRNHTVWWPTGNWEPLPNGANVDVYFGVHPSALPPDDDKPLQRKRSRIATIQAMNCFIAEYDFKDFESEQACKMHINGLSHPPSFIIRSGGGFHCYWLLTEPVIVDGNREVLCEQIKSWVGRVGADPDAADMARILRPVGTYNQKYDPAREVTVAFPLDDRDFLLYEYDEIAKLATKVVTLRGKPTKVESQSIPERTRNATLTSLAGTMRNRGMERDEIYAGIWEVNVNRCQPPLDEKEVQTLVNSVCRYEPKLPATEVPLAPKDPKTKDYIDALRALGYEFKLNVMDDSVEVNGVALTDPIRWTINSQLRDWGYKRVQIAGEAWGAEAYKNRYHPIRDYLNSLVWDETDHIWRLGQFFTDEHGMFYTWLKRWMIGAVARVLQPGVQNRALVLDAPQNIGKSFFVRWLCPLPTFFIEAPIAPDDKDCLLRLANKWIWEVGEMGSTFRKADREALKFFLTQESVTLRKSYGREDIHKPAMASFIGTLNDEQGFLSDPTGNRRYMVTTLEKIDWAYANDIDVNQCWAQAHALYTLGEPWNLSRDEVARANEINELYTVTDPVGDIIDRTFVTDPLDQESFLSARDVLLTMKERDVRMGNDHTLSIAIGRAMRARGIRHSRRMVDGERVHGYPGVAYKSRKNDPIP